MEASSKYNRDITGLDGVKTTVDVYRVLVAFDLTDPELQHAIKKLLCAGLRGKCDETQDIDEAILSLEKLKERKGQEGGTYNDGVPIIKNCLTCKRNNKSCPQECTLNSHWKKK